MCITIAKLLLYGDELLNVTKTVILNVSADLILLSKK